jgi:quinol monooxygenase YgiN
MSSIAYSIAATLGEGKAAEFKAVAAEISALCKAEEPGTLAYHWYLNDDETGFALYERYADSDAFLAHLGNLEPHMARFMSLGEITGVMVFGEPSPDARTALEGFGATFYGHVDGFARS